MTTDITDIALQTLIEVYERDKPPISLELLKDCYFAEKKYQYEKDEELPLDFLRTLVTEAAMQEEGDDAEEGQ